MTPTDQAKLFSLYTQINSPDNYVSERSGLGLLLSRELCRALGGELYLESSEWGMRLAFTDSEREREREITAREREKEIA